MEGPNASVWQAPLVPVALAFTGGIILDRYAQVPIGFSLAVILAGLIAWLVASGRLTGLRNHERAAGPPSHHLTTLPPYDLTTLPPHHLALLYLALSVTAFGAAYHHWQRDVYPTDDIGNLAGQDPRPVRLRGVIVEEPAVAWRRPWDPLRSFQSSNTTHAVLQVSQLQVADEWLSVSGRAQMTVGEIWQGPPGGPDSGFHVGDQVQVDGRLLAPQGPSNPGEADWGSLLRDQHIRAQVQVRKTTRAVTGLAEGWPWSVKGRLAVIRAWGQRKLQETLTDDYSPVATALLLGEGSTMTHEDWEKYIRTAVIHVLAISGQHLAILAAVLWFLFKCLGIRRRRVAWLVALFLLSYALVTGGRPPAMRAAVTVCACCLAIYLRRPALSASTFALAWIVVALINPTDLFTAGCQLTFLSVAILYWGVSLWFRHEPDPLAQLVEESRPFWQRILFRLGRFIAFNYAVTLAVFLAIAPLVAFHNHLISPIAPLIGPPVILLGAIALLAGFLLLLSCLVFFPLVPMFAWVTEMSLAGCEGLVDFGDRLPFGHWYVGNIPPWWLWIFYLGLLAVLTQKPLRLRWRWAGLAGTCWLCLGLVGWSRPAGEEFRCTFLAVGHGGCAVLEMPDGRTVLYDSGSMNGPDVTRRQVAPFLWNRGIRRIDEVILSHADLDHFNGLPALLERFPVGQVTSTPTFADKTTPEVRETLAALERHKIPLRIVRAGDRLSAGPVDLEVLHPPVEGPEGKENFRSLVLLVRHEGHRILLTGDLEGPGLARVVAMPLPQADILMAPHHGSRAGDSIELTNRTNLARRTHPQVIVSCQGFPRSSPLRPDPYAASGATFLPTWPHGAVTIRSGKTEMIVETFKSGQRLVFSSPQ
jgi:competence protein ComEC